MRRASRRAIDGHRDRLGLRAREDSGRLLPGPGRDRVRDRASRWRSRRSPTSCGWRRRPPISTRPRSSPRRSTPCIPDQMLAYNLSPSFNWDTTGMTDDEMRRFPDELGKLGLRLQLHHLRRSSDRRPGGRGVRDRAARGRHAGARPAAAAVPPARVAVPHAADAGRRAARSTPR